MYTFANPGTEAFMDLTMASRLQKIICELQHNRANAFALPLLIVSPVSLRRLHKFFKAMKVASIALHAGRQISVAPVDDLESCHRKGSHNSHRRNDVGNPTVSPSSIRSQQ